MAHPIIGKIVASTAFLALLGSVDVVMADDAGKGIYENSCIACHGADGKGTLPGVPDFTEKDGRLSQSETVLVKHVTDGFQSPGSSMAMPPKGGNPSLTDSDVQAVVKYLVSEFNPR